MQAIQCTKRITQLGRKRDPRVLWKVGERVTRGGIRVHLFYFFSQMQRYITKIVNYYFFQ